MSPVQTALVGCQSIGDKDSPLVGESLVRMTQRQG